MRPAITLLATALTLACVEDEPAACEPNYKYDFAEGNAWGPCVDPQCLSPLNDDGTCSMPAPSNQWACLDDALQCVAGYGGHVCALTVGVGADIEDLADYAPHPHCAPLGIADLVHVVATCQRDAECVGGQVCSEGVCLWPW